MNTSESNQSFPAYSLDYWQTYLGSTWPIDSLYFYGLTSLGIVGFLMNASAYYVLRNKIFHTAVLFKYLRISVLNSLAISLFMIFVFIPSTYRIFDFTNSYGAMFYGSYLQVPIISVIYFNGHLLELSIIVERILNFVSYPRIKRIIKFKYLWAIWLASSIVLNVPIFFSSYPTYIDVPLDDGSMQKFYYYGVTDFASSTVGKIILYCVYFVRDIMTLVLKTFLNGLLIYLIKKYINRINNKPSVFIAIFSINESFDLPLNDNIRKEKAFLTDMEKNLTYMSIFMNVVSLFENVLNITSYISYFFAFLTSEASFYLYLFTYIVLALKQCTNLIIFYLFNNLFRQEFKKCFHFLKK